MKVAQLLEKRRKNWQELEGLCSQLAMVSTKKMPAAQISRFATLYRAACADLALADAYQLPPNTVQYLHRLVGQAHNQLYRSRAIDFQALARMLLYDAPQRIFNDRCVQLMFVLFWGVFILSAVLAYSKDLWPGFAEHMVTSEALEQIEEVYTEAPNHTFETSAMMMSYYIWHNGSIGLRCFAGGLLIIPGLAETMFNAASLGAMFGYMARPDVKGSENFYHFVTAHGPFELTAIVLGAGAGLRLGMSWLNPRGLTRISSLRKVSRETLPIIFAAVLLFCGAAFIEGFISPKAWIPYPVKAAVAVLTSGMLMFYFVILGFPRRPLNANG